MPNDELHLWYLLTDCVDKLREAVIFCHSDLQVSELITLTARQIQIIQAVCRLTRDEQEGVSLKKLAAELHLSSSATSLLVENLVKKGELERLRSDLDRRKVLIRLSPRCRKAIYGVQEKLRLTMKDFWNEMPEDEHCRAIDALERLRMCILVRRKTTK